jgi:SpoIIAA-like
MAPVVWDLQNEILVVKFIIKYTDEQIVQAFTEALASAEYRTCETLLIDARSAFDHVTPGALRERVRFMFDAIQSQVSRCAIVSTPDYMVSLVESKASQFRALGMDAQAFTSIEDAFAWLKSPAATN